MSTDGNCLFCAVSVALVGNESLARILRVLTAIELYENAIYYAQDTLFETVAVELSCSSRNMFVQSLSDVACQKFTDLKCHVSAIKEEAYHISHNFNWSSFICIMALSSVIEVYTDIFPVHVYWKFKTVIFILFLFYWVIFFIMCYIYACTAWYSRYLRTGCEKFSAYFSIF